FDVENAFLETDKLGHRGTRSLRETIDASAGVRPCHHPGVAEAAERNRLAMIVGSLRLASGVSFLVSPKAASRIWGSDPEDNPTASLLLRSMSYRDALVGGMLPRSGMRGDAQTAGWFLASAGADMAD